MGHYQLIEHTADIGLEAWGETRTELFIQAALALREILVGTTAPTSKSRLHIKVDGADDPELLVNWLGELLFLFENRRFLPATFVLDFKGEQLCAEITGESMVSTQLESEREVKAVTHHQVVAEQTPDGWHGRIYLDL